MTIRTAANAAVLMLGSVLVCSKAASAAELEDYFGTYVGVATVVKGEPGESTNRDIDMIISPYKKNGFQIEWIAVSRVNDRRDVPGVTRQKHTVLFEPNGRGCCLFVEVGEYDPFREREALRPMLGEPVRWAVLDENGLQVYSFAVLEDGDYELQIYNRRLTDQGIDLLYERIEDGTVKRRITGHTVRTSED